MSASFLGVTDDDAARLANAARLAELLLGRAFLFQGAAPSLTSSSSSSPAPGADADAAATTPTPTVDGASLFHQKRKQHLSDVSTIRIITTNNISSSRNSSHARTNLFTLSDIKLRRPQQPSATTAAALGVTTIAASAARAAPRPPAGRRSTAADAAVAIAARAPAPPSSSSSSRRPPPLSSRHHTSSSNIVMARAPSSPSAPAAAATNGGPSPPGPPAPPRRPSGGGGGGGGGGGRPAPAPAAAAGPSSASSSFSKSGGQWRGADLSVATLNLRGVMDRWRERRPVLARAFADLDADVLCMQEVLTGEAAQEGGLLGPLGYAPPLVCRAALGNLAAGCAGWPGAAYAAAVRAALAVPPLASAMAALPGAIEAWRERRRVAAPWARAARDAAMAPFFGNSIAVRPRPRRVPPGVGGDVRGGGGDGGGGRGETTAAAAKSSSWPPLVVAARPPATAATAAAAAANASPSSSGPPVDGADAASTPASWPLTPGEALSAAFGWCCGCASGEPVGASSSSSPSSPADAGGGGRGGTGSRVWVAGGHEVLVLGGFRAAHRVMVGVRLEEGEDDHEKKEQQQEAGAGRRRGKAGAADADAARSASSSNDADAAFLWVVNAHLDHADPATRAEQAAAIIRWIDADVSPLGKQRPPATPRRNPPPAAAAAAVVLAGDFNAPAGERGVHGALREAGFVSAYASAHGGQEPARTWPTGLQAPLADDEGEPHCADYVYVRANGAAAAAGRAGGGGGGGGGGRGRGRGAAAAAAVAEDGDEFRVRVLGARVGANEPWPQDPTLYPSDHAAVRAVLRVERRRRRLGGRGGVAVVGKASAAAASRCEDGFFD